MADRDDKKRSKPQGSKKKDEDELSDFENDPEFQKLNEIERETRIAEYKDKREKERKLQELKKEAKTNKSDDLLSHLQSKRQIAKDRKERLAAEDERRRDYSDEDSESDGEINNKRGRRKKDDDDEDYVDEEEERNALRSRPEKKRKKSTSPERRSPSKPQTVTMELLEKIRLSRKNLALLVSHTIFEKTVKGAFVRVNQSSATKATSAHDYIIAEIVGVQTYPKYYSVDDKETNKILLLKHGSKERPMKMCFVSNGEFTGTEFTKWINRMQRENQKLPPIAEIERKADDIKKGLNYRYSNEEIKKNIDQRIDEKLRKGEALTSHEIELMENKKVQKEMDLIWAGSKNAHGDKKANAEHAASLKKEISKLDEAIKNAKKLLKAPKNTKSAPGKKEEKSVAQEMADMFKDDDDEEEEKKKEEEEEEEEEGPEGGDIEKEDEDERAAQDKMIEELKKSGKSLTEVYDEMKREFIKNHKVDLSIDKFIEDWNIENEVA